MTTHRSLNRATYGRQPRDSYRKARNVTAREQRAMLYVFGDSDNETKGEN